jgi:hypothetical protein
MAHSYRLGSKFDEMLDIVQTNYGLKNRQDACRLCVESMHNLVIEEGSKVVPISIYKEFEEVKELLYEIREGIESV